MERERRRVQPLTWIVAAALMPVVVYDVWQTLHDVRQRQQIRAYALAANLGPPAAERPRALFD